MTEQPNLNQYPNDRVSGPRRKRSLVAIGAVLWVMCFALLAVVMVQGRHRSQAEKSEVASEEDDGKSSTQIRLVPRQDGSLEIKKDTDSNDDSPWEADGIADFSFTNCNGQKVTKQDLLGKPFIIGFIFTHCRGPCPNVTLQMKALQNRLKDFDFNLVTLTVDPKRDTPDVLLEYGKHQEADFDHWKFLTGDQAEIYGLIQQSFKMPVEEVKDAGGKPVFEIIHSRNLMLVDATGRVVGKFDALSDEDMARIRKELKRLAKPNSGTQSAGREGDKK